MPFENAESILRAFLAATSSSEFRNILNEIGDHSNVNLDEAFGPFHLYWHAFGNNPSNISSIGLGTKPGRSLTERLTNAIDAILEDRVRPNVELPRSAREAAKQWFGRPITGPEDGLFKWNYGSQSYDRRIAVVLNSSGEKSAPTVDVFDDGIGIAPDEFPGTILSLQSGNKIRKWYLQGAFGQGGASTLAFGDYALIVSRSKDNPRLVGFTVIRVLKLDESYKEDSYAYLCQKDSAGRITVPSCQLADEPLEVYAARQGVKLPTISKGTLVRHISYKLNKLDSSLNPSPGNLYHYLHASAFDPLLPFRVIDIRDPAKSRDELVTGSRNRLMKLATSRDKAETDEGETKSRLEIRHHRPMEYFVPHGTDVPSIGVEYWVVFHYREGRGAQKGQLVLRPQSNESFIETGYPVVGTLNGQNQGQLTGQLLRDIGLGMVSRHIVIHIDATQSDSRVRRELFSTNREGFKDGPVLANLTQLLTKMLEEDDTLYEIERELTEKLAKRELQTASEEVKRQVAQLLREAGLEVKEEGPDTEPAPEGKEKKPVQQPRQGKHRKQDPLPTLPFPQVTKFKIVAPQQKMSVHLNDHEVVLVETDADTEFDKRGLIHIRSEPVCLELAGTSGLRGGRIRWRLRPLATAKAGDIGKIVVSLTKTDGTQLTDSIDFEVLPAEEEKAKKAKGFVPPFKIIAINPLDNPDEWATVWPDLGEEASEDDQATVAYRPMKFGGFIHIYYSTVFLPFKAQVEKLKTDSPTLSESFRSNYEVWIAYHAILQENSRTEVKTTVEDEVMEQIYERDRVRVAKMQVKQAMSTAELMVRALKGGGGE